MGKRPADKGSKTITVFDGPISPMMLRALGHLTVAFQNMEAGLAQIIWRVADLGGETAAIVTSGLPVSALHAKVGALLRHHWKAVWDERGATLLARVDTLIGERNRLVHALWYAADTDEGAVTYRATARAGQGLKQGFTAVPVAAVEQLAEQIAETGGQLHSLGAQLYPDFVQRHLFSKPPHSATVDSKGAYMRPIRQPPLVLKSPPKA